MGDVDLCGALGDAEYVGDGLRGEALGGELRDLALAGTERLPEARKFADRFLAAFDLASKPSSWHPRCGHSSSLPRLAVLTPDEQPVWHLAFRSLLGGRAGALCLCLPGDFSTHLAVRSALPGPGREKNIPDAAGASGII